MWRSLEEKIPVEGENLRLVRSLAEEYFRTHTGPECWEAARALYVSPHFQVQEAGVFLCGWLAPERPEALAFLRGIPSAPTRAGGCRRCWLWPSTPAAGGRGMRRPCR